MESLHNQIRKQTKPFKHTKTAIKQISTQLHKHTEMLKLDEQINKTNKQTNSQINSSIIY